MRDGSPFPGYWTMDYPRSDRHLLAGIRRLTRIDTRSVEQVVTLDGTDDIYNWPVLYGVEVGHWDLRDDGSGAVARISAARRIFHVRRLSRHGALSRRSAEWDVFTHSMSKVFPDRPIEDIPDNDPIFHTLFDLQDRFQVPGAQFFETGITYEAGETGKVPHWRCIRDDKGRIMVAICHNMDLGDAWEWADDPRYRGEVGVAGLSHRGELFRLRFDALTPSQFKQTSGFQLSIHAAPPGGRLIAVLHRSDLSSALGTARQEQPLRLGLHDAARAAAGLRPRGLVQRPSHLPGWYPREMLGTPFSANLENFPWIPTHWPLLLFDPDKAYAVGIAIAAGLAALFTYLFAGARDYLPSAPLPRAGPSLARARFPRRRDGWASGESGRLPGAAALLWLADRAADAHARRRDVIALAIGTACVVLAGHPQLPAYAVATALLYVIWRGRPRPVSAAQSRSASAPLWRPGGRCCY